EPGVLDGVPGPGSNAGERGGRCRGDPDRAPGARTNRWRVAGGLTPRGTIPRMARNFLSVDDLEPEELRAVLDLSSAVKADPGRYAKDLRGKAVALIFEKPSTRTRVSFEVAVAGLGAHPLVLSSTELQLGRGETIEDTGRVLSRYVDAVVLRTFGQERL